MRNCLLLLFLLFALTHAQLKLNLLSTSAIITSNSAMTLSFKATGGSPPYTYNYLGIPLEWRTQGNDLIVAGFSPQTNRAWTFDVLVTDASRRTLLQTIKLAINGYQINLEPVTVGVVASSTSSLPKTSQSLFQNFQPQSQSQSSSSFISTSSQGGNLFGGGFSMNDIINQYPGLTGSSFGINYNSSSSITPTIIANSQAQYNPARDSRQITPEEIKKNAAILRQSNANKGVANLVAIIQRLTANVNAGKANVAAYQTALKEAQAESRECGLQVGELEETSAKISNALSDKRTRVIQYEQQISEKAKVISSLNGQLSSLNKNRQTVQANLGPDGAALTSIENQLARCESTAISPASRVDEIQTKINKNNVEITLLQNQINDSKQRLTSVNGSLSIVQVKIQDLKAQLASAQKQQRQLLNTQAYYLSIPVKGNADINNLTQQNKNLQSESERLQREFQRAISNCSSLQSRINESKDRLMQTQTVFNSINTQIAAKQKEIADVQNSIDIFKEVSKNLPLEVAALNLELDKVNSRLRQQRYLCGVAEEGSRKAQQNYNAAVAKFDSDSLNLKEANQNLEKARAEKELAEVAVNQIIATNTNALPFGVPSSNTNTPSTSFPSFGLPNFGSSSDLFNSFNSLSGSSSVSGPKPSTTPSSGFFNADFGFPSSSGLSLPSSLPLNTSTQQFFDQAFSSVFETGTSSPFSIESFFSSNSLSPSISGSTVATNTQSKSPSTPTTAGPTQHPITAAAKKEITGSASETSGLWQFECDYSNPEIQEHSGILVSVSLGTIVVKDAVEKEYSLNISPCTQIYSTSETRFFVVGATVKFIGLELINLFDTVLFNAFTVRLIQND